MQHYGMHNATAKLIEFYDERAYIDKTNDNEIENGKTIAIFSCKTHEIQAQRTNV